QDIAPRVVAARSPVPVPISSAGPWQEAGADGLLPGVEYTYQVGHPTHPQSFSCRAPAAPGAVGFTIVAVGDMGASASCPAWTSVNRTIAGINPTLVLALGDLTYADDGSQANVD